MKCACDVCETVLGQFDARTPDGYCAFCDARCYPVTVVGARQVRSVLDRGTRYQLHQLTAIATAAQTGGAEDALELARQEAADTVARVLTPIAQRAGRGIVQAIKNRISGK